MTRNAAVAPLPATEKQYPTRACDFCRRRKTKCDGRERARLVESQKGATNPGSALDVRCSNCMISGADCTYGANPIPRGYPKAYVENLERCQDEMAKLITRLLPYIDLTDACGPPVTPGSWREDLVSSGPKSKYRKTSHDDGPLALHPSSTSDLFQVPSKASKSLKVDIKRFPTVPTAAVPDAKKKETVDFEHWREPFRAEDDDALTSSDEEYCGPTPVLLGTLDEDDDIPPGMRPRFHGKSSGFSLVRANLERKGTSQLGEGKDPQAHADSESQSDLPIDWEAKKDGPEDPLAWPSNSPAPALPPPDLLKTLINLYFRHVNIVWPLLHRPSFEADISAQRHERDLSFRCVVIAACAVASRYCGDRRVLAKVKRWPGRSDESASSSTFPWEGSNPWMDDPEDPYGYEDAPAISAGWKYYHRIMRYNINGPGPVRLTELQTSYLTHQYLLGLPNSYSGYGWVMVGAAIRKAQDQGAHREKSYHKSSSDGGKPSLESELWRRAFWCLVMADRTCSAVLGQCCCIRDEDIDAELPLEVDDEFWTATGPSSSYQQPKDRPSYITAFNVYAKLSLIHVWALRTLYAIDESKAHLGLSGEGWEKAVVARLNEALDEWIVSVPPHLKWDPYQTNDVWRTQSANLYLTYNLLQMRIYQPFSPGAKILGPSPKPYPSNSRAPGPPPARSPLQSTSIPALAICGNAARSNAHILECLMAYANADGGLGTPLSDVTTLIAGAFLTGIMLITVSSSKAYTELGRKGQGNAAHEDPSTITKLNEIIVEDQKRLDICTDVLKVLSDRWLRASSGLNLLMSTVDAVPCADLLRTHAYPESQTHSSPSLSPNWSGSPDTPPAAPSPPFPDVVPQVAIAGESYEPQADIDYVKAVPLSRQFHAFSFAHEFGSTSPPITSSHEATSNVAHPVTAAHSATPQRSYIQPSYIQVPINANDTTKWAATPATTRTETSPSTPQSTDDLEAYPWNTALSDQPFSVISAPNPQPNYNYSASSEYTFFSDHASTFQPLQTQPQAQSLTQQPLPPPPLQYPQYSAQEHGFVASDQFGSFYPGTYPDPWSGYNHA